MIPALLLACASTEDGYDDGCARGRSVGADHGAEDGAECQADQPRIDIDLTGLFRNKLWHLGYESGYDACYGSAYDEAFEAAYDEAGCWVDTGG
jgi:hypothetical protein